MSITPQVSPATEIAFAGLMVGIGVYRCISFLDGRRRE